MLLLFESRSERSICALRGRLLAAQIDGSCAAKVLDLRRSTVRTLWRISDVSHAVRVTDRWFDTSTPPAYVDRAERERTLGALQVSNLVVLLPVASQEPDGRSRRLSGNGAITARTLLDDEYCGFLHYYLLSAPTAGGGGPLLAIRVTDIAVFEPFRNQGVASALYEELRESHPEFVIGADQRLTDDGRRVATHYRLKYPDRHVGRFDTDLVLHLTAGADDPTYEPEYLAPTSNEAHATDHNCRWR